MERHHLRTLRALFAHPLHHGVRASAVEALCRALGAEVEDLGDRRLRISMPSGTETWIRVGSGVHHPDLDAAAMLRLRHLLEEAGVSPDHAEAEAPQPRGDIGRRLVLHLDHHATRAFLLEGDTVERAVLHPHGVWGSGENLTHRHDRDAAGQRAPRDSDYLRRITDAIAQADAVLLLGHGTGESDMRQLLLHHLETHRRDLLGRIVGIVTLDAGGLGDRSLLAIAREHFGNQPHRRPVLVPGQAVEPA
jgi:hypothetical protein